MPDFALGGDARREHVEDVLWPQTSRLAGLLAAEAAEDWLQMSDSGENDKDEGLPAPDRTSRPPSEPEADKDAGATAARMSPKRTYIQKMAHELKTPISAIVAASEVMRDEQLGPIGDERYRRYAADIHDSAKLMLAIIDRMMLQRSRESGPPAMNFTENDPVELLHGTISTLLPLAESSGVRLKLVTPSQPMPKVIADASSLKQILINLITNALKFTARGGHVVATTSYVLDGPLTFEVRDTGRGMTEVQIEEALKGQVPKGQQRDGGGLGVGLPLVTALAQANGARLDIKSVPEQGTAASIIFPKERVVLV